MAPGTEGGTTWLDDLKELILKKKEESAALKKIQDSLQTRGQRKDVEEQSSTDEIPDAVPENDFTLNNQNIPSNP